MWTQTVVSCSDMFPLNCSVFLVCVSSPFVRIHFFHYHAVRRVFYGLPAQYPVWRKSRIGRSWRPMASFPKKNTKACRTQSVTVSKARLLSMPVTHVEACFMLQALKSFTGKTFLVRTISRFFIAIAPQSAAMHTLIERTIDIPTHNSFSHCRLFTVIYQSRYPPVLCLYFLLGRSASVRFHVHNYTNWHI